VAGCSELLSLLEEDAIDVVLLGDRLAGSEPDGCLDVVVKRFPEIPVVVASGSPVVDPRDALRRGACGYIAHGGDLAAVPAALRRVLAFTPGRYEET